MFQFIIFMLMSLLYITQGLIQSKIVNIIFILITILAFQQAFHKLNRKNKIFTGFLFFGGITIHFIYGNRGMDLFVGLTQNLPLLAIILLAPLISLPLKGEGALDTILKRLDNNRLDKRKTYDSVSSFMLMLAPILNMGALRIVHGLIEHLKINNRLLTNAYYGGFTPAIMWSPFFASVGIVMSLMEMPYISYMPVGLVFAIVQFIIAIIILRPSNKEQNLSVYSPENDSLKKNYILMISYIVFLVSLLIVLEMVTELPILLLVSINCITIPILWTMFRRKWDWMKSQVNTYKNDMVKNTNVEVSLFLSAGLFGKALMNTPIATVLKQAVIWSAQISVLLIFLFVVSLITFMAFLGIHQIIAIPVIVPLLVAPEIGISLHAAAFIAIYSWMISSSISPLNALNIIISQCVHQNGIKVAFNWNGKFFLMSFISALIFVFIIDLF